MKSRWTITDTGIQKNTVRDKITGTGRRIITEKGPDGITHKCVIHDNRNSQARFRLQQKYHQRQLQRLLQTSVAIMAASVGQSDADQRIQQKTLV